MNRSAIKTKSDRFKIKKTKVETLKSKWQAISFGGKLFLISPIAVLLSYNILDDTLSARYFLLTYGSLGVLLYLIFKFIFRKDKSIQFDIWGYIGAFFLCAAFCAFINYGTIKSDIKVQSITLDKKGESSLKSGSRACYIFFIKNKKRQRFTTGRLFWDSINEGQKIKMYYQESLLGFDIVKEFKK